MIWSKRKIKMILEHFVVARKMFSRMSEERLK
jgi:hypothetical protein